MVFCADDDQAQLPRHVKKIAWHCSFTVEQCFHLGWKLGKDVSRKRVPLGRDNAD